MERITLQKHDINWENIFSKERDLLSKTFGKNLPRIHHIGSTAVPDLLAKPIIDISAESLEFPPSPFVIEKLTSLGYEVKGESGIKGRFWFTKGEPRKFNLHYCPIDSEIVKRQIKFRDSLIQNEKLRREYELVKLSNSKGKDIDNNEYAGAKSELITKVINE